MDKTIELKQRLPQEIYQSPPSWWGYLLILPGILLVSFLFVGMGILTYYSFLTFDSIEFIIYEFTLENWRSFLTTDAYYFIFFRTIGLSLFITILAVGLALPYAYLTIRVRSSLLRKLLLISIFVPFFTGVIVRAYGWLIILGQNGLVNSFFGIFGLGPYRLIGTEIGVIIGLLQIMIPFAIIMIAPAVQNIDRAMELAASNLGANPFQTFYHIVIPLAKPGIAGGTIVVFTITAATYAVPALIGGGRVDFIANVIYRSLFDLSNYPLAATFSVALVIVASIFVLGIFQTLGSGTLGVDTGDSHE
ncbi:ABC transporter permease [Natrarchaeobius halalkaliphilus]|uniref:ABC transporter permease n=2 Tax=Natrarchaeobius halalkaliphilus TaxID=1679091 RepID=A0A3N6LLN6_9EURY|nr:ABC transporter permease [Natrarchaeobius halalkaliphilus]